MLRRMMTMSKVHFLVFIYCLLLKVVQGILDVTINQAGYNYYSVVNILNSTGHSQNYNTLLDTGNPTSTQSSTGLSIIQSLPLYNSSVLNRKCLTGLVEDAYYNIIFNPATKNGHKSTSGPCPTNSGVVSFNSASPPPSPHIHVTNYSVYAKFTYPNTNLYNWSVISGDMGMAYCSGSLTCPLSYFQTVLKNTSTNYTEASLFGSQSYSTKYVNSTTPLLFALDFKNSAAAVSSTSSSSMQLGYLNPKYKSQVAWSPMLTASATYHQFNIQSLSMCGINLLANWSATWPVMVDTGSVCLNLPQEIYDSVVAWLNTARKVTASTPLPGISFQMSGSSASSSSSLSSATYYIPLENLILHNNTLINSNYGAPLITVDGVKKHLCIIRGNRINTDATDGSLNVPMIVFGTLPLQSLYFAADFTSGHAGLASKLNQVEVAAMNSTEALKMCKAPKQCLGDQRYIESYNTCGTASCSHYVFVTLDPETQTCSFNSAALGFGLFFIIATLLLELASFFMLQYTTYEFLIKAASEDDGASHSGAIDANTQLKLREAKRIDFVTRLCGRVVTMILDPLVALSRRG